MQEPKIYQKKVRDFGQVFGATFGYIRQNFKSFFGSIILFTGPVVAIVALLISQMVSNMMGRSGDPFTNGSIAEIGLYISGIIFLVVIIQTVYVTVLNQHIILNESMDENTYAKTSDVSTTFFGSVWRVLGNGFLLLIITFFFALIYGLINAAVTALFSTAGPAGIILAFLLQMGISFIISPILVYVFITSIFVVQRDKIGLFSALQKVFFYMKGNFWITWCVSFTGYLMIYISSALASIPIVIFIFVMIFSRFNGNALTQAEELGPVAYIVGALIFVLTVLLYECVYSAYFLICTFQYSGLEEKKEGSNLLEKINQIQNPVN